MTASNKPTERAKPIEDRIEERLRFARDSLPGQRDGLPEGTLGGLPTDPQGDENRDPPANAPIIKN